MTGEYTFARPGWARLTIVATTLEEAEVFLHGLLGDDAALWEYVPKEEKQYA